MTTFIERPISLQAKNARTLVLGVGVNDTNYITTNGDDRCPYYARWKNILTRVYNPRKETYKGLSICESWLSLTKFKSWMELQDWEGKEIDKDLLVLGNNHYSPETCCFLSRKVNIMLQLQRSSNTTGYTGVVLKGDKYVATCRNVAGLRVYLGAYDTPGGASVAYRIQKAHYIEQIAKEEPNPIIAKALFARAIYIRTTPY